MSLTTILINRCVRDGWYVYTCDTMPGLFVASQDDRKAWADVPDAVKLLVKLDYGVELKDLRLECR